MTPDWIEEIEKRKAKATPGPWIYDTEYADDPSDNPNWGIVPEANEDYSIATVNGKINASNEAKFIAHARTDIPTLLQALNTYRKAIEEAPHYLTCTIFSTREDLPCTCWKSKALSFNPKEVI